MTLATRVSSWQISADGDATKYNRHCLVYKRKMRMSCGTRVHSPRTVSLAKALVVPRSFWATHTYTPSSRGSTFLTLSVPVSDTENLTSESYRLTLFKTFLNHFWNVRVIWTSWTCVYHTCVLTFNHPLYVHIVCSGFLWILINVDKKYF